jgi:hypothetical protein
MTNQDRFTLTSLAEGPSVGQVIASGIGDLYFKVPEVGDDFPVMGDLVRVTEASVIALPAGEQHVRFAGVQLNALRYCNEAQSATLLDFRPLGAPPKSVPSPPSAVGHAKRRILF